jgi:membrane-bound lytic murein transglycosylase D
MKHLSIALSIIVLLVMLLDIATTNDRLRKLEAKMADQVDHDVTELPYVDDNQAQAEEHEQVEGVERLADTESAWAPAVSFDLPKEVSFAGEAVPLHLPDVRERFDRELHINSYLHNSTMFILKRANRWLPQIEPILKANNIPDDFKYMALIESALLNDVSPRGAVGFWQIMKPSGKELGLEITSEVDERYDPIKATHAACKYLKKAYSKFNNWTLVAASYDRGMAGMQRAMTNQRVDSYYDLFLNDETARYVFRLLAMKEIVEHPARYGFKIHPTHLYQVEPLRYVEVDQTVPNLVSFSLANGANYKLLKRFNPWLREEKLTVKKGRKYVIALPAG